jgi:hypothetical protein
MPAIRDWTYVYNTSNSTSIQAPLPWVESGDLLLALVSADTGSQTWSSSGWTQLFTFTSGNNIAVLWKIAGASETNPTFAYNVSETANCHLLSIRDVNTTTPFNGTGGDGTGYNYVAATNTRATMPTLTTTVNNSLIIYVNTTGGIVVPTILEGPVTYEDGADGSAHSQGFSWGFKRTAGSVGGDVFHQKTGAASAGITLTLGISPPASGATYIPTYCVSDASTYVDPVNGTTSYNTNNSFSSVGLQLFGNTINSAIHQNGSVTGAVDVGINAYHSMGQLTGTSVSGRWTGSALVLAEANRPTITGKNIIAHARPSSPRTLQNTDAISRPNVNGVAMGITSNVAQVTLNTNSSAIVNVTGVTSGTLRVGQVLNGGGGGFGTLSGQRIISFGTGTGGTGTYTLSANTTGSAIGITVNALASRVWHVHGANTPWNSSTHVPLVINTLNTAGNISARDTIGNTASAIGFFCSGFALSPVWQFGSIWVLDTTVVAGGDSSHPLDARGIFKVCGQGKERLSVMQQGSSQTLILQPIQLGNGGTDPIYLNLDGSTIEFPRQYSVQTEQVFYCSSDNIAGITYYAGAGDTVIHTNAVVSSGSKFFWGFHPSSANSAVASYTFSGLLVNGAGNVTLKSDIQLHDMSFNACGNITSVSNTMSSIQFKAASETNGFAYSITGSTQAAIQAELDKLSNINFENNISSRGALRIVYTGVETTVTLSHPSMSFSNNTKDIWWQAPAGTALIWENGTDSNASTSTAFPDSNTITIKNIREFTITNIISGSKIRLYAQSDLNTVLAGVDSISGSSTGVNNLTIATDAEDAARYTATYKYAYTTNTAIYVVVIANGYEALRPSFILTNISSSLKIAQILDRQYANS